MGWEKNNRELQRIDKIFEKKSSCRINGNCAYIYILFLNSNNENINLKEIFT